MLFLLFPIVHCFCVFDVQRSKYGISTLQKDVRNYLKTAVGALQTFHLKEEVSFFSYVTFWLMTFVLVVSIRNDILELCI